MAVLRDVVAGSASTCISEGESAGSLEERLLPIAHRIDSGGIVLKTDFLNVVAPAQSHERTPLIPSSFPLLHVNCLIKGSDQMPAIIQGEAQWVNDDHPMRSDVLSCLRTKWSGLRVTWAKGIEPSLL
ncbi:hypothetical protein SARC_09608 [Sphaeroforma arctica JP610]|uniref:Uncharacterized protein n=1 Tax=Sphaeroforma arctica JP610 TaxID=667725 RepID=A0A0L0FPP1_9EUKA|nr:hypothetical protein SARC_09608 [Sphaeroforma arctica JP610]KNC77943.1 hypothetical protein SARC_09608 [Sphaeroforma arctica JP610]|eukprot:XP_014151845.1 hypothetical protein SARC_09608 [Sphaeroforma arctica JP610]